MMRRKKGEYGRSMSDCSTACHNPCATCPRAPRSLADESWSGGGQDIDPSALLREAVNACVRQSARDAARELGIGDEAVEVAVAPDLEAAQPAFVYKITVPLSASDARWNAFESKVARHRLVADEAACLVRLRGGLASRG
jgi:uncharacterized OsmC-like protein